MQPDSYVWLGTGPGAGRVGLSPTVHAPAVTIAVSKKPGTNAIVVARQVIQRVQQLRGSYVPEGVHVTVTRNYGETANDKAIKLIEKLLFATASVVLLVMLSMGRREAVVVGAAVIVTLAATLFASWAWGFTINRVSLFALIFSIGILVDDAIVIVENIHRHLQLGSASLSEIIPKAVDEVGGPTILATFTVIAALLPMAFVSGLMGPYMSPIPINASMGMMISLAVALIFTPWLCRVLLGHDQGTPAQEVARESRVQRLFERFMRPFLVPGGGRARRHKLYWAILAAIVLAVGLVAVKLVVLKMLPFDNKSEFQIIANLPQGTTAETTARLLDELSHVIERVPEVSDYEAYAGTAAPINFNGLVRQYYLRQDPRFGDIQVNLVDKRHRSRKSHTIALAIRPALAAIGRNYNASVQVVEVPPGPPVRAPIVAEIYGPRYAEQRQLAQDVRKLFDKTADIVDVDDSNEAPAPRLIVDIDRQKAALLGVTQAQIVADLERRPAGLGCDLYSCRSGALPDSRTAGAARSRIGRASIICSRSRRARPAEIECRSRSWCTCALAPGTARSITRICFPWPTSPAIWPGASTVPSTACSRSSVEIAHARPDGAPIVQRFTHQPDDPNALAVKWDGEWQITYETFRDMGIAYSVGLLLIYLLVVGQFGSYALPLIIMAPIPLTIIGVMPGHALLGAQFTATSMIGMIALAGIIVRNSILLVDFIDTERRAGGSLEDAVVRAAVIRAKPIALTALAAMIGGSFILDDPIFNGLAVSLIFGIFVSTVLTLLVIPVLYYAYLRRQEARAAH